jgi:membrane-associated protease RseP (regulator of RpoE activity)
MLSGCASYSNMTYQSAVPDEKAEALRADRIDGSDVTSRIAKDFEAEVAAMHRQGYQLTGFSQFVGPLVPRAAKWNARTAAKRQGAEIALLAPPQPARLNQHRYLMTFWRKADDDGHLFGGFYGDSRADILGVGGCGINLVTLTEIADNSPAHRMGLQRGDRIIAVDDKAVFAARHLDDLLLDRAGEEVEVRYLRGSESRVAVGLLGPAPEAAVETKPAPFDLGLRMLRADFNSKERKLVGQRSGAYVDGVHFGSRACENSLYTGDLILAVNGRKVDGPEDVAKRLEKAGDSATLTVRRAGETFDVQWRSGPATDQKLASLRRLELPESNLAEPPWVTAKEADFTWVVATAAVLHAASTTYTQHLASEQARIDEYNRMQAQSSSSGLVEYSGSRRSRGSGYAVVDSGGELIPVDNGTAQMLRTTPGLTVTALSRRGGGFAVYDRSGPRVARSRPQKVSFAVTGMVPVNMEGIMRDELQAAMDKNAAMELGRIGNPYDGFF